MTAAAPALGKVRDVMDEFLALTAEVVLCSRRRGPESADLPFGAVISPQPGGALLPQCNAAPPACAKCGAYINSFVATTPDTGEWHCTFCMHHNPEAAQPIAGHDAVDYLVAPPAGASPPSPPPLRVLALDLASPQAELDGIKAAAAAALDAAPDHTRIALMAYGRALSVFRLGGGGGGGGGGAGPAVHADVLPPDSEEAGQGTEVLEAEVHSAQLGECRGRLAAALRSLRCQPSSAGGLASLGAAVAAAGALGERVQALAAAPSAFDTPASQAMQRQQARSTAHVIVLTAAPSAAPRGQAGGSDGEEGEEASGYLEDVAAAAADRGVAVDVLPSGPPGAAAVLSELALGSGGVMRAHRGAASALGASLGAALAREAGLACGLEVRCSSGLSVRGAVGPLAPVCLAGKPARDWRDAGLPRHMLSPRTWHYLCSAPEARQGATLLLQGDPLASPSQRHVYIQVTLTWAQPDGSARRRVATKRLAATQDPDDVARATDFQVAAVLLASTLAAEAMGRQAAYDRKEAEILRRQLGKQLFGIASRHGEPDPASGGWLSGPSRFALPPGAAALAETAYNIHYGPLLGRRLPPGGGDARALQLSQLMGAGLAAAARMCRPRLRVLLPPARRAASAVALDALAAPALEFQAVPAFDVALLLSLAAVLDCGDVVFAWLGEGAAAAAAAGGQQRVADACGQLARRLAGERLPAADVVVVRQGSPQQGEVLARLMALSRDAPPLRLRQLPLLSSFEAGSVAEAEEAAAAVYGAEERPSLVAWLRRHDVLLPGA